MSLKNTKLVQLIDTMSPKEWRSMESFLLRHTEQGSRDHRLYTLLSKHYPFKAGQELNSDELLKKVFGQNEKDDRKLRRAMNRLFTVAEEHLATMAFEKNVFRSKMSALEVFGNRNLPIHHHGQALKIRKLLDMELENTEWYNTAYQLELNVVEFEEQLQGRKAESRTQEISIKLDELYAVHRLKLACAILTRERLYDIKYDQGLLGPLLDQLNNKPPKSILVKLYHQSVTMMQHTDDHVQFERLTNLLKENGQKIADSELKELHIIAQNHCIQGINKGNGEYVNDLFELYKLGLDQDIIQKDPIHFAPAFKNIVSVAIRLKEFSWAKSFIDNFSRLLGKNEKDYLRYNLALLHFAQNEFVECRKHIHKEMFSDTFIKMNVRILLLKTYYELNQLDLLESELDNFKQFLHRNKQLGYHRKNCSGLIRYLRSIITLKPGDTLSKNRLSTKLKEQQFLAERKWLLAKLSQL